MNDAEQILVIILSTTLAIFLILSIILVSLTIQVMRKVRHITEVAEQVVNNVESVTETFRNVSGPLALFKVLSNLRDQVMKSKEKK